MRPVYHGKVASTVAVFCTMADHDQPTREGAPVADHPAAAASEQERIDAFVHPSVGRLNGLAMTSSSPPMAEILAIVRAHPEDHDACIRAIHRLWGNQVALQVSIAVPHLSLASLGGGPDLTGAAPEAPAGPGLPVELDASREGDGAASISAARGPVTGSVTVGPHGPTGGSIEAAGDLGTRAHGSASIAVEESTVTGEAALTHRVGDNVTIGGIAHVEGDTATGEVRAETGATVRIRTSDRTMLQAQGLIDSDGNLTHRIDFTLFRDRVHQLPLTDEGRSKILSLYLQGSTGPLIGQERQFAPQVEGGITIRIPGT
jgi:hypothetical protein